MHNLYTDIQNKPPRLAMQFANIIFYLPGLNSNGSDSPSLYTPDKKTLLSSLLKITFLKTH